MPAKAKHVVGPAPKKYASLDELRASKKAADDRIATVVAGLRRRATINAQTELGLMSGRRDPVQNATARAARSERR
jgi:hypothetical protein